MSADSCEIKEVSLGRFALTELLQRLMVNETATTELEVKEKALQVWRCTNTVFMSAYISKTELKKTIFSIERHRDCLKIVQESGGGFVAHDERLGLYRSLYVSSLGNIYINIKHDKTMSQLPIGKGSYKIVTHAILYGATQSWTMATTKLFDEIEYDVHNRRLYTPKELLRVTANEAKFGELLKGIPNVAHYREIIYYEHKGIRKQGLYMPFYNKGNLADYMTQDLSLDFLHQVTHGMLAGVAGIHEKGVIHRDIKYQNIMLNEEESPEGKKIVPYIIDFGFAIHQDDLTLFSEQYGAELFVAPEVKAYFMCKDKKTQENHLDKISTALDIYALGILLGELWLKMRAEKNRRTFSTNDNYRRWAKPEEDQSVASLIWLMTRDDPDKRPTAKESLELYSEAYKYELAKRGE